MHKFKITQAGFAGFNGTLGAVAFKGGVSVEPLSRSQADRIALAIKGVQIDADGREVGVAGIATRVLGGVTIPAEVLEPRPTATAEEVEAEAAKAKADAINNNRKIYTEQELDVIAKREGIEGIREIARRWGVRERSIGRLIEKIIGAQSEHKAKIRRHEEAVKQARAAALAQAVAKVAEREKELTDKARKLSGPGATDADGVLVDPAEQAAAAAAAAEATREREELEQQAAKDKAPADETPNAIGPGGEPVFQDPNKPKPTEPVSEEGAEDEVVEEKE